MKKKINITNLVRRLVQIAAFIAMPGLFIDTFSGIKAIVVAAMSGGLTLDAYAFQIANTVVMLVMTIIVGRFFCGFLCSFGAMGDLAWFIGRKLKLPKVNVPKDVEPMLKSLKYVLLGGIVLFVWILGTVTVSDAANPWSIFGMYSKIGSWPGIASMMSLGGLLLLMIFAASMFIQRFFCRYLCPLGAVFAIVSNVRVLKINKPTEGCGGCAACSKRCPMHLDLSKMEKVSSGECIDCMECTTVCPRSNARLSGISGKYATMTAALVCCLIISGGYYGSIAYANNIAQDNSQSQVTQSESQTDDSSSADSSTNDQSSSSSASDSNSSSSSSSNSDSRSSSDSSSSSSSSGSSSSSSSSSSGSFTDGTYTGTGTGYRNATTTVKVTVSNGNISNIEVTSNGDDWQYFNRAESVVISEILDSQTVNVDAVSGATFSSNGIMDAVADALGIDYTNPNSSMSPGGH